MEIIVLLKPDGTVLEVNRTAGAAGATPQPRTAIGEQLWEAPTLAAYPAAFGP